jgi:Gas vesicle protein K
VRNQQTDIRRRRRAAKRQLRPHHESNPDNIEQGLAKLVLTLIDFLRQLLERQAIRRMEGGALSDQEIEEMGEALMRLEAKIRELADQFGLSPADLNIDLGPLGRLR